MHPRRAWSRALCAAGSLAVTALGCQALVELDYSFAPASGGAAGTDPGADEPGGGAAGAETATAGAGGAPGGGGSMQGNGGSTQGSAGCSGAGSAGACGAAPLVLHGTVFDPDTSQAVAGVSLVQTASGSQPTPPSNGSGDFEYAVAAPEAALDLTLQRQASGGIPAFQRTLLRIDAPRAVAERSLRLPSVSHEWLVEVATDCEAITSSMTPAEIDAYFNLRSTLLVEVPNTPNITRDRIKATVSRGSDAPWVNEHESPLDVSFGAPAHVCFLQREGNRVVGGLGTATTDLGQFVMFRVRNAQGGGGGTAVVSIDGLPGSAAVNIEAAGETGVVRLGAGWDQ
jgi:hypothetical protein